MSNLIKRAYTIINEPAEKRVIDSNGQVAEKINKIIKAMEREEVDPDGFSEGLNAERVELLTDDMEQYDEEAVPQTMELPENIQAEADEIINEAKAEAERIIAEAEEQAQSIRAEAEKNGHQEGFERGREEGLVESEKAKSEYEILSDKLEDEYQKKIEELEPMFIDTLTDIYEHVFHVRFGSNKEVIFHLIQDAVRKVEGNTNFIIHVSKEDYGFVSMQKKQLLAGVSNAESAEIVEDITLKANECMIETGSGIFDCSLETQLEGLKKELKLLSYKKS
ncbi:FliH/SctL family protein [Lachnospiraceae bacterium C1.1]|nr:FliH/SctL family protein [Lachnospiraceae bacterium C1.1]